MAVVGETAEIRIDDGTVLLVEDMPPGPAQVCLTVRMHSMEVGFDQVLKQLPEGSLPAGSET